MTFSGFAPDDLAFLKGLAAHNDREWFTAHRAAYDERLKPTLEALIAATTDALAARGVPLAGDAKKSLFRIHRDVRFSKDKSPYKTHVSATLTRTGPDGLWRKMSPGMVYVHIEPEGGPKDSSGPAFDPDTIDPLDPSTLPPPGGEDDAEASPFGRGAFVAAGFYLSERPNIDAFRRAIAADPAGWGKVVKALTKAGLDLASGDPLKRLPRDFADQAGSPWEAEFKRTRWLVRRPLSGAEIASPELPDRLAAFAADARPLLDFGWKALDGR